MSQSVVAGGLARPSVARGLALFLSMLSVVAAWRVAARLWPTRPSVAQAVCQAPVELDDRQGADDYGDDGGDAASGTIAGGGEGLGDGGSRRSGEAGGGHAGRIVCVGDRALEACGPTLGAGARVRLVEGRCRQLGAMQPRWRLVVGLKLDINGATAADLELLDGIGPKLATAIVAYRTVRGPFVGLDDLRRVRGVGPKMLERLAAWVEVGNPTLGSPVRDVPLP